MMIDVHMADGRTIFRFKTRGHLVDLVGRKLDELDGTRAVACWVSWHPGDEFVPCRILSIRRNSVSFTREVVGAEREAFDLAFPPPERVEKHLTDDGEEGLR